MDHLARAWWDLLVVKLRENVLWIAAIDPVPLSIEHERVHEVRPGIDFSRFVGTAQPTAAADHSSSRSGFKIDPNLIGIARALGEIVTEIQSAYHNFNEVILSRLKTR